MVNMVFSIIIVILLDCIFIQPQNNIEKIALQGCDSLKKQCSVENFDTWTVPPLIGHQNLKELFGTWKIGMIID